MIMLDNQRASTQAFPRVRDGAPAAAVIKQHLGQILSSRQFDASERNRRFLRFVVEETLAGRANCIKGYGIALSVFDRDASFDPQIDPVVRIEASRLRRSLERYYLTDGKNSPLQVTIPKGGYVPRFELLEHEVIANHGRRRQAFDAKASPSLQVLPFASCSSDKSCKVFAAGLSDELLAALVKKKWLHVFASPASSPRAQHDLTTPPPTVTRKFVLNGSVRCLNDTLRIITHVTSMPDNECLWSHTYQRDLRDVAMLSLEIELGRRIAGGIARIRKRLHGVPALDPVPEPISGHQTCGIGTNGASRSTGSRPISVAAEARQQG
jgi:adenylate cyclase